MHYDTFKNHKIRSLTKNEIVIGRPGTRVFEAIIHVNCRGQMTVTGDIGPLTYAYGPTNLEACVEWMGSRGIDDEYVWEKASIGSGGRDLISEVTYESLEHDWKRTAPEIVESRFGELEPGEEACEERRKLKAALRWDRIEDVVLDLDAQEQLHQGLHHAAYWQLYGHLNKLEIDPEWLDGLGRQPTSTFECVHAAVQCAHRLLKERSELRSKTCESSTPETTSNFRPTADTRCS